MCEQEALNLIPVFEKFRLVPKDKKLWNPYGIIYPIRGSLSQTRWCFSWENDGPSKTEAELTWLPGGKYTSLAHSCHVTCFSQWYRRQYNTTHIQAEIVELAFLPFISFFFPCGSWMAYHWSRLFLQPGSWGEKKVRGQDCRREMTSDRQTLWDHERKLSCWKPLKFWGCLLNSISSWELTNTERERSHWVKSWSLNTIRTEICIIWKWNSSRLIL